jgi:hypothetical protein
MHRYGQYCPAAASQTSLPVRRIEREVAELEELICQGGHRQESKESPKISMVACLILPSLG